MKKILLRMVKIVAMIIGGALLGFLALLIVCKLPTARVQSHVRESGTMLGMEGELWSIVPSDGNTRLDNFTDSIMLLTSAYEGDEGAVDQAVFSYRVYKKGATKEESCENCGILADNEKSVKTYPRYWHGYKIILKPLLAFLNINEIRDLNMFFILVCCTAIILLLYKNGMGSYIIPYLFGICFLEIPTVAKSLQNSTIFHLISLAGIVILLGSRKEAFRKRYWAFFLMVGMATSYFDFLTYPIATLGFTLIFYVGLVGVYEKYDLKFVWHTIENSFLWGIGYLGMWAMKWVLGTLFTGQNLFLDAKEGITLRAGNEFQGVVLNEKAVLDVMKEYFQGQAIVYLIPLFILCLCVWIIKTKGYKDKRNWMAVMVLLVISIYPFMWYYISKNHSYQHAFFTYRSMSVFVFGIVAALVPCIGKHQNFME